MASAIAPVHVPSKRPVKLKIDKIHPAEKRLIISSDLISDNTGGTLPTWKADRIPAPNRIKIRPQGLLSFFVVTSSHLLKFFHIRLFVNANFKNPAMSLINLIQLSGDRQIIETYPIRTFMRLKWDL